MYTQNTWEESERIGTVRERKSGKELEWSMMWHSLTVTTSTFGRTSQVDLLEVDILDVELLNKNRW